MDTRIAAALIIVGALLAWAAWYAFRALSMRTRLSRDRGVKRAETGQSALVQIDVALTVTSDAGPAPAALASLSRSSESESGEQGCAHEAQVPASSASVLVTEWARGRFCISCGAELVEGRFSSHHIALLEPSGMTREWIDVGSDRLPLALATSLPLCWNCHIAATFRRLHSDLVTDREDTAIHVKDA